MKLENFIEIVCKKLEVSIPTAPVDNAYFINYENNKVSISMAGENILLQSTLGSQLKDSNASKNAALLSEILQFNLKRMRVLDETLSLNPETKQLCLRKELPLDRLTPENSWDIFDDFLTNVTVIEKRFFSDDTYA